MGDNDGMPRLFSFFFRLFLAFLAAKFLSRLYSLEGLGPLLGLALLFLGNIYLFDYFNSRERFPWRRPPAAGPKAASPPVLPPPEDPPPEA